MTPDLAGTWWQQPLACRLGCVYFLESYEYYRTWASEGFFLEGVIVDFFRGWPKRFLPGGKQCWSFIVSTPKIGEKHFSTKNLTAKYYQNPRRPRCQGRKEWGRGAQFPERWVIMGGTEWLRGAPKIPTMSQVLSSIQYICFRETSGSNMGAPNLLLAPGAI